MFKVISRANKYIDETAPWILAKDEANKPRLARVMYNLLETIRICATLLTPFIPDSAEKIRVQIGAVPEMFIWDTAAEFGKLPSGWLAFAPIVLPIILMGLASAFSMAGVKADFISFLGTPIIALAVGCIIAIISLFAANKGKDFYKLTNDTLKTVGPILFVTAAGGVLGKVIASSDMVNFIKANAEIFESIGIFFPFLMAAILKSAQGSSTVAITTTAGIVAPLLPVLGLDSPALSCLTVIAIGAGAMTVSHANDSYFWVVTNFGEMTPQDGYKTQTLGTLVIGVVSIIGVFIVSLFLH